MPADEDPATLRDVELASRPGRPATTPLRAVWNGDVEAVERVVPVASDGPVDRTDSVEARQQRATQFKRIDFDGFYFAHRPRLIAKLTKVCAGDARLAEDVAQETFLAAYRRRDRLNELEDPAAWLATVGTRVAIKHFEREALRTERTVKRAAGESTVAEFDYRILLNDLLHRVLSLQERQVVEYRYLDGHHRRWIADRTGISLRTVDNRISSALAKLRRHIAQSKEDES
ncbi:RNA polymerase sigma factor [Actinokineospora globicatena]|uniref:RNA polymerase sigma factor n=1 Tax=Actinokineospora globicatena TaxID=103729 RepID=UPI0020A58732|nr:RNA polymerase sigma factor [Actinokineospora globicatena]MCP2302414.1 RNA polymerase sigma-70 factor, ECF subfamily [Actinokineospora globicatena]